MSLGDQGNAHFVEFFIKLIQLCCLCHDILVHQEWGLNFLVSALAQKIEAVRNECLVEVDTIVCEEVATVT
jgi:hypothetical protein